MFLEKSPEMHWALNRLQDRVSFTGWFLAIFVGIALWAIMLSLVI